MKDYIKELAELIKQSENIVFFGGAGVSTESGIPDFRSADGIYSEKYHVTLSPEEIVSHTFYVSYPEEFFSFYREKLIYKNARPNPCHEALKVLEDMGKLKAIVTQNIDGLHQMAGSDHVYELHGSVLRNFCEKCHHFYDVDYILESTGVPSCEKCNGRVKPDVVLYEEGLDDEIMEGSIQAIRQADLLIIGGTSLNVYPAAGMLRYFKGKHMVLINKSETSADAHADLVIREPIGKVFHEVIKLLVE